MRKMKTYQMQLNLTSALLAPMQRCHPACCGQGGLRLATTWQVSKMHSLQQRGMVRAMKLGTILRVRSSAAAMLLMTPQPCPSQSGVALSSRL